MEMEERRIELFCLPLMCYMRVKMLRTGGWDGALFLAAEWGDHVGWRCLACWLKESTCTCN